MSTCRVFLCHIVLINNRQLFIAFIVYYYYFSLRLGQQDPPNWIWSKRLERTMLPNDPYCISEVIVCPRRVSSWRWAGKEPQENAQHPVAHWHTITRLWIWSMTQSMVITLLREAKDRWKCLICLFPNVAICLMNDFIKCQGYLLVSNLGYKHITDPIAWSYNGFKVRYIGCHVVSILQNQVKINSRVGPHKGFANRIRDSQILLNQDYL